MTFARTWEECRLIEGLEIDGSKRLPICFCLDTSGSMSRARHGVIPLDELKRGLKIFLKYIKRDAIASSAAEIAIVTFDDNATSVFGFGRLQDINDDIIDTIETHMHTYMEKGLELSLDKIEKVIELYDNLGVGNYSPWLVVMSDGDPTVKGYALEIQTQRIADMKKSDGLVVIPIGIGREADMDCLSKLMPGRKATGVFDIDFDNLFEDLGKSVLKVSKMVDGSDVAPTFSNDKNERVISDVAELTEKQQKRYKQNRIDLLNVEELYPFYN